MYPEHLFLGLDLYDIFFALGIVMSIVIFAKYTTKQLMPYKIQSFYLNLSLAAIAGGVLSAFLFQAVYNWIATGVFLFKGITFLGGFVGGAAIFLGGYKIFKKENYDKFFPMVLEAVPCSVLLGHAIGRIGCFMAGCCHGIETDSILGIHFPGTHASVYPTQLYESIFLFAMFAICSVLFFKKKGINLPIYLISYGIFRFLIEFLRGDYRGDFIIPFLSPSQTISFVMVAVGAYMLVKKYLIDPKQKKYIN